MFAFAIGSVMRERCSMPTPGACCPGKEIAISDPGGCGSGCMVQAGPAMATADLQGAKSLASGPTVQALPISITVADSRNPLLRAPKPHLVLSDQVPLTLKHRVLRI